MGTRKRRSTVASRCSTAIHGSTIGENLGAALPTITEIGGNGSEPKPHDDQALPEEDPSRGQRVTFDTDSVLSLPDCSPTMEKKGRESFRFSALESAILEPALTDDVYSLIYIGDLQHTAFWYAVFVFCMQLGLLILLFVDLVDTSKEPPFTANGLKNRFKFPPGIEATVALGQFIGVMLVILFGVVHGDMLKGLDCLFNGYDPDVAVNYPAATRWKWFAAGLFQTCTGFLMVVNLFIQMMQATTVIGMCLNFAALYFVQEIDDVAFSVAALGLFGTDMQLQCEDVSHIMIPAKIKKRVRWMRRTVVALLTIVLYIFYAIIISRQAIGVDRCSALHVQFGDAYISTLPYFSGRFESQEHLQSGRPYYLDESKSIKLRYSRGQKGWVFEPYENNPEKEFFMSSSQTTGFDVTEVADQTWYIKPESDSRLLPADFLSLTCNDCMHTGCNNGICVDNKCKCNEGFVGPNCEDREPDCQWYGMDLRSTKDLANIPGGAFLFKNGIRPLGDNFTFFDRDIYVPYYEDTALSGVDDDSSLVPNFIIFSGRRWIIFTVPPDPENARPLTVQEFKAFLDINNITASGTIVGLSYIVEFGHYTPYAFSQPSDFGTLSYSFDPAATTWVAAKGKKVESLQRIFNYVPDNEIQLAGKFLCSDCTSPSGGCQNNGKCDENGYCQCLPFNSGHQCEYVFSCQDIGCFNGGTCDPITGACKHCFPSATGDLCQYPLPSKVANNKYFCKSPESNSPCKNRQRCNGIDMKCECELPFFGEFCEQSTRANCSGYEQDPCQNGGHCDYTLHHPICRCLEPFVGDFCNQSEASGTK